MKQIFPSQGAIKSLRYEFMNNRWVDCPPEEKENIMTRQWKIFTSLLLSALVTVSAISIYAQSKQPESKQQLIQPPRAGGQLHLCRVRDEL